MQAAANAAADSICGLICGFYIIVFFIIILFAAGAIYFTYWIYKRAVRNGILEAEKLKDKKQ